MARKSRPATQEEGNHLPSRVRTVDNCQRQKRSADGPDKRVDTVPDGIKPGNLVGKELRNGPDRADPQHPRVGENIQHLEIFGQRYDLEMHRKAGRKNGEVKAPSGKQAQAGGEP